MQKMKLTGIAFLIMLITPTALFGQSKGSISDYVESNSILPQEKVFLHIDRQNYLQGDTIWFKAYLWFGNDQIPDTASGVLYVDLLNQKNRVVLTKRFLIQNGTSNGDFVLDTTIGQGSYTVRAYTRWMQNLNTGEPYYQEITINPSIQYFNVECSPTIIKQLGNDSLMVSFRFFELDPSGALKSTFNHKINYSLKIGTQLLDTGQVKAENTKEKIFKFPLSRLKNLDSACVFGISINDKAISYEKLFQISLKEGIDIQFFPEGGKLINGLPSKVAFKAIGTDGLSREVAGVIETEEEEEVTEFKTTHKGMGYFILNPEPGKKYFAHTVFNNRNYIIPLPSALETGSSMSISCSPKGADFYLTIRQVSSGKSNEKYVIGSSNGKIWFSALLKTSGDSCRFRIPVEHLPEGVCRITVLNQDFKPESERLIYVNKNQRFKLEVTSDSSSYNTRSKASLLIKATNPDGEPVQTDLSISVVDEEQIENGAVSIGITAYKLLKSELKGFIEDPDFYFSNDSVVNPHKLDLLMLTHGYRNILPDTTGVEMQKFQPEKSFEVSGTVKYNGIKWGKKNYDYKEVGLSFFCWTKGMYVSQCIPDSLGRFRFTLPLLLGKTRSLIQATNSRMKPLMGEISLNEITVDKPKFDIPSPINSNFAAPAIETVRQSQANLKTIISKDPTYGAMNVTLGEIKVIAKAKNWYLDFEPNAEKIVDLDSIDPDGNKYESLLDLLVKEFDARIQILPRGAGKAIFLPCLSLEKNLSYYFPIYVINGNVAFNGRVSSMEEFLSVNDHITLLRVNEIKKLMVLPPGEIPSHYSDFELGMIVRQSLVVIETYSNFTYRGDPTGIKTFMFEGLDAPRTFYSPKYEGPSRNNPVFDGRATLFWGPSIKTDSLGQVKIDFYTSDRKTKFKVIINGIDFISGAPGQSILQINSTLKE